MMGRGRLNWHAVLPSRRELCLMRQTCSTIARTVSHNYTRESEQCFQCLASLNV
jgi:hypothetical protein